MTRDGRIHINDRGGIEADIDNLISVSEASRLGVSALARRVEAGDDLILLRHGKPAAAVVGIDTMRAIDRAEQLQIVQAFLMRAANEIVRMNYSV